MKKLLSFLLFTPVWAFSQIATSDITNDGAAIYDFANAETITTAPSGVGYRAKNGAAFYHYGPATGTLTVNGNYDAYTLTPGSPGIDRFTGLNNSGSAVEIAGNTAPLFGTLQLANGGGNNVNITNAGGVNVGATVAFTNGITTTVRSNTSNGALRILSGATYSGSVNNLITSATADAQHVNGYVGKRGNQSFVFPVGAGNDARPLAMSAPSSATDEYSVAWILGNPTTVADPSDGGSGLHPVTSIDYTSGLISVSTIGQWDWIPVTGTGTGLTITVSIPDESSYALAQNLRLAGWNGTQWTDLSAATGNSSASGNTENSTLVGVMKAGITAVTVASIAYPLPLTLLRFDAKPQGCNNIGMEWEIADAINVNRFEIERSIDGTTFHRTGTVAYHDQLTVYEFTEKDLPAGKYYYRLKMIDIDGLFKYSKVSTAVISCSSNSLKFFPNPATDMLSVTGLEAGSIVKLYGINGQLLQTKMAINYKEEIKISQLKAATYVIVVEDKNGKSLLTSRFVKIY